jgi:hypothetical protein
MGDQGLARALARFHIGDQSAETQKIRSRVRDRTDSRFVDIPSTDAEPSPPRERDPTTSTAARITREQFIQFQLSVIDQGLDHGDASIKVMPTGPVVQPGVDCVALDDYLQLKRRLATRYRDTSMRNGWKDVIGICSDPICINPVVPGFEYCANHMTLSSDFENQILLTRCIHTVGKNRCMRPCAVGERLCRAHIKGPRRKGDEDPFA